MFARHNRLPYWVSCLQNDWEPRRLTGPKTIEEVHYEAQLEDFYLRERAENLGYHF